MIVSLPPDSLLIFLRPFVIFNGVARRVPAATPQRPGPSVAPSGQSTRHPPRRPRLCRTAHGSSLSSSGPRGSPRTAERPRLSIARAFANSGAAFLNLTTNSRNLAAP